LHFTKILPPNDLIFEIENLKGLKTELLQTSQRRGEAVGATGILCLLKELLNPNSLLNNFPVIWNFIPCLNWDDQHDDGNTLSKVMKTDPLARAKSPLLFKFEKFQNALR
jgi:hypothetical protein